METLRGFVRTVWETDAALFKPLKKEDNFAPWQSWSEPDGLSGSMELRRITTRGTLDRQDPGPEHLGVRADFFELHWADLTADSTWGDFRRWLWRLLMRRPVNVPPRLFFVWVILWAIVLVLMVSSAAATLLKLFEPAGLDGSWLAVLLSWKVWTTVAAIFALLGLVAKGFLTAYLGDVARYVSAAPRNIRVRKDARERGLKLLKEITEAKEITEPTEADSAIDKANFKYDRIVIVGHSLGSILAHDLIWLAWNELSSMPYEDGSRTHRAVQECERTALELMASTKPRKADVGIIGDGGHDYVPRRKYRDGTFKTSLAAYRLVQRELFHALADGTDLKRWLISDLVTVGSPLTHASLLVARDAKDLETKVLLREVLYCQLLDNDEDRNNYRFSYQLPSQGVGGKPRWQLHHGSAMGPVRWTNIHDASGPLSFLRGDMISGPLSFIDEKIPNFGPGIVDVKVAIRRTDWLARIGLSRLFTHTQYWTYAPDANDEGEEVPAHVVALRDAINVLDDEGAETRLQAGILESA